MVVQHLVANTQVVEQADQRGVSLAHGRLDAIAKTHEVGVREGKEGFLLGLVHAVEASAALVDLPPKLRQGEEEQARRILAAR